MMKIRWFCVLLAFGAVGCRESNQVAEHLESEPNIDTAQHEILQNVDRFNKNLAELTELAKRQETDFQFASAARVWGQVQQLLANQLGADQWQTKNSVVAYERAIRKSQFSSRQLKTLRRLGNLHEKIKHEFQNGPLKTALQLSSNAIEIQSQLFGEHSIEVGQMLIQVASFESRLNHTELAIKNFHDGIKILKQHGYTDHPELELAHAGLASLFARNAKFVPAIANQKEATRIAGTIWGKQSLKFATQANQLGAIFHRAGNLEVAFDILDRTRSIRQTELGSDHLAYAHSCLNLGAVLLDLKRLDTAEQSLTEALTILQRESGDDDNLSVRCKSQLATIFMLRKQPEQAEPYLQDVVDSMLNSTMVDFKQLLTHQYRLSVALARQGKYKLARPIMEQVIKNQKTEFGLSDTRTVESLKAYALLLERTNDPQAASIRRQIGQLAHLIDSNDFQKKY